MTKPIPTDCTDRHGTHYEWHGSIIDEGDIRDIKTLLVTEEGYAILDQEGISHIPERCEYAEKKRSFEDIEKELKSVSFLVTEADKGIEVVDLSYAIEAVAEATKLGKSESNE